jgi:hypothetical protein
MNTFIPSNRAISTYLLDSGDSFDMGVDGSVTPVDFAYNVPSGFKLHIGEVATYLEDTTAFSDANFAAQPPLTNGIAVIIDGVTIATIKTTLDFIMMFHHIEGTEALGKTERQFVATWSANIASTGRPFEIKDSFVFRVQDDLSATGFKMNATLHGFLTVE